MYYETNDKQELEHYSNYPLGSSHPQPTDVWWDDNEHRQVLYGPKGEVLSEKCHRRRIGYFKGGY